jgi:ribosomal protein S18 acetylase RimI-like enzyme
VLPDSRGRGVGAALWAAAASHFREHGVQDVAVVAASRNAGALRFYERAGFVPFTSRWWISPVPDWPADPDVVPVDDLEVIRPLHRALDERHALVEPAGLPPRRAIDEVWDRHSGGMLTDGSLLRYRDLGFVHATVNEDGWATLDTGPEGHIEMLAVCSAARGQGIGAKLLHAGAQATGANVVTLDVMAGNDDAERFYAREGFRRVAVCLYQRL